MGQAGDLVHLRDVRFQRHHPATAEQFELGTLHPWYVVRADQAVVVDQLAHDAACVQQRQPTQVAQHGALRGGVDVDPAATVFA